MLSEICVVSSSPTLAIELEGAMGNEMTPQRDLDRLSEAGGETKPVMDEVEKDLQGLALHRHRGGCQTDRCRM